MEHIISARSLEPKLGLCKYRFPEANHAPIKIFVAGGLQTKLTCYNYFLRGLVAQSVEQRIENPCVGGSIPPKATTNKKKPNLRIGLFAFLLQLQTFTYISSLLAVL